MENNFCKIELNNYKKKVAYKETSKSDNEKYSKSYEQSYYELIKHMQKAPSEYKSFINSIHKYLTDSIKSNYEFITFPNKTIGLRYEIRIFSTPTEFFKYLLFRTDIKSNLNFNNTYFKQLYNLYYDYLKHFGRFPQLYEDYKYNIYKIYNTAHDLYHIFAKYNSFFIYINKELLYTDPFYNDKGFSTDVIKMLKRHYKSLKNIVPLLKTLPKIIHHENYYTSAPCCSSNYSFNFIAKGTIFHAYFNNGEINYEENNNIYMNNFTLAAIASDNFTPISCSQSWFDILYDITGGIKENMDNFSILFSLITTNYYKNIYYTLPSKNTSPLSLYVVYAPQEQANAIRHWLKRLLPSNTLESDYQLKDLTKPTNIFDLIKQNYFIPSYIPVYPSKSKESENQIKTIKKLIQRKEITVKDRYGLSHILLNNLPVICFVDNPNQLRWLQANFKTRILSFKSLPPLSDIKYDLKKPSEFICSLSIYGLKLLYTKDFKYNANNNSPKQIENITENFVNDFLKFEENHTFYADDLYDHYVKYYQCFYGNTPLTKIRFTKEMRKLLPCQYKKPRHSRSDNRYAFIGISINNEKAAKLIEHANSNNNLNYNNGKKTFSNYISDMQNNVNEILQTLYNQIYNL